MITLDSLSPVPPFEQIRSQLVDLIRSGALSGGYRLPSIRQLAGDLRLAPGTVARAYTALENDGLTTTSRAGGTRVRSGQSTTSDIHDAACRFVTIVKDSTNVTLPDALAAVRVAWDRL